MRNRVVLVDHATPDKDDRVADHLSRRGYVLDWRMPCQGDSLEDAVAPDLAGTVVYGGMYNVPDTPDLPFMQDEIRWLGLCMDAGLPTLGICQGAQMIAYHLGAEVGPHADGQHEFGYYPVRPTEEGRDFLPDALHMPESHFHEFQIPEGAVRLAESALFRNQAFRVGARTYGLQFHPEVTRTGFRRWQAGGTEVYAKPGVQPKDEQDRLGDAHDDAIDTWFRGFLDTLFGPPGGTA
jgi:GMP synthase (glutamine-hydrolysing)